MSKKKFEDTSTDTVPFALDEVKQEEISEEEANEIRQSLDGDIEEAPTSKKLVIGIRPNNPPKKSWWDKAERQIKNGATLVPNNWDGDHKTVCKVCSPGKDPNTYMVKFSQRRDESIIEGFNYKIAPEGTVCLKYMDEYTKWRYEQELKNKKT